MGGQGLLSQPILTEKFPAQLSTAAIVKPVKSAIIQAVQILVQSVFEYIRFSDSGVSGKLALYSVGSERVALIKAGGWSVLWRRAGLV